MESSSKLKDLPLYIDDSSMLSPMELRARARRIASSRTQMAYLLIVVDYLQLMELPASSTEKQGESNFRNITIIKNACKGIKCSCYSIVSVKSCCGATTQ